MSSPGLDLTARLARLEGERIKAQQVAVKSVYPATCFWATRFLEALDVLAAVVPLEPTEKMIDAMVPYFGESVGDNNVRRMLKRMLQAALRAEAGTEGTPE